MKKKGSALLAVIIVMVITFMLAAIMIEASIKHNRVASDTLDGTRAYYCAESGIYDAINYLEQNAAAGASVTNGQKIYDLYSQNENVGSSNYLFGDYKAYYVATITVVTWDTVNKQFVCAINSTGTYNTQNSIVIAQVELVNNGGSNYKYILDYKKSSKD